MLANRPDSRRFPFRASKSWRCAILVGALLLGLLGSPSGFALDIQLVEAPAGTTLTPIYDANLNQLGGIMEAAAQYWESIIKDNHTVTVTYGYVDLPVSQHGLAQVTAHDGLRATEGNVAFDIETNSFGDWFFDPTPTDHSEFSMQQVLYRDLGNAAQGLYYDSSAPEMLEVGYWGNYVGPDMGRDALTTAVHELGHILGLSGALPDFNPEVADGDYDFNPFYTQVQATAVNYHSPAPSERDHVRSSDSAMAVGAGNGDRNLPGATDVFALASVSNWLLVDLPRKDFWGNGATNWNNTLNWPGNRAPDAGDEVYVRNGADAILTIDDGAAGNLFVREDATVSTGPHSLHVTHKATIEGFDPGSQANLVVNAGGRVTADEIELLDGGLLTVTSGAASGLVEVDVDDLVIQSGGVLLGNGDVRFLGELSNDGTITAIAGAGDRLSLLTGSLDLDGSSGNGEVLAVLGDLRISANLSDGFDGVMTVGEGREVLIFPSWTLGDSSGEVRLQGGPGSAAVLTTNATATFARGEINTSGQAMINGRAIFEAGMSTTIADGTLTLNDAVVLNGGQFPRWGNAPLPRYRRRGRGNDDCDRGCRLGRHLRYNRDQSQLGRPDVECRSCRIGL